MIPVVTPSEMAAIDEQADEPIELLIQRAGQAVAWKARQILKGTYGKRVMVIAGKGNNGADGLEAAKHLQRWGIKVNVISIDNVPLSVQECDLLIDAVVGTGLKRPYNAPDFFVPTLSVDIPSGICGLTGEAKGNPFKAKETITFQALKQGHLLASGPSHTGSITIADIGLDVSETKTYVLEKSDVATMLSNMHDREHKWKAACWVIGGSHGMTGAPLLASKAALRSGSGYVRLSIPGELSKMSSEIVGFNLPSANWEKEICGSEQKRFNSLVVGPGLGKSPETISSVHNLLTKTQIPIVLDADALYAIGQQPKDNLKFDRNIILTPHDAEYEYLTGHRPQNNRVTDVCNEAMKLNAIILLKGPTTVVAHPDGRSFLVNNGDQRLATAGTGDVLSGIIGGLLSQGVSPFEAAATGAWIHAESSNNCLAKGMVASDIINAIPEVLSETHMG
ncbi:MAG: NAD(P)H-hydrate dehydratase [Acidimicrobiaceae bacterium]|jgi:NAD(P)H-hydrate epimerase|nr:NAD(P)H-hydrate dehydratase [Acidimicrobiaceae bacterium]|tara:strand:- start:45487 stop:46836 length:1350 start_codon:yes stop_codon:yes gene_type:complete